MDNLIFDLSEPSFTQIVKNKNLLFEKKELDNQSTSITIPTQCISVTFDKEGKFSYIELWAIP